MSITKIISKIKKKLISPSIYVVDMEANDLSIMHISLTYSLEEALELARAFLRQQQPTSQIPSYTWKLNKYHITTIDKLIKENILLEFETPAIKKKEVSPTNALMQQIIDTKDIKLFQTSKNKFNNSELAMLKNKLNIK